MSRISQHSPSILLLGAFPSITSLEDDATTLPSPPSFLSPFIDASHHLDTDEMSYPATQSSYESLSTFTFNRCGTLHEAHRQLQEHMQCKSPPYYTSLVYGILGNRDIMHYELQMLLNIRDMMRHCIKRDDSHGESAEKWLLSYAKIYIIRFNPEDKGATCQLYDTERDLAFKLREIDMLQNTHRAKLTRVRPQKHHWKAPVTAVSFWTGTFLNEYNEVLETHCKHVDLVCTSSVELSRIVKHLNHPLNSSDEICSIIQKKNRTILRIRTAPLHLMSTLRACWRDVLFTQLFSLRPFTLSTNNSPRTCSPFLIKHYFFRLIQETVQRIDIMSFELNEVDAKLAHFLRRVKFLLRFMYPEVPAKGEVFRSRNLKSLMRFVMMHGLARMLRGNPAELEIKCHVALSLFVYLRDFERHLVRQLGGNVQCMFASSRGSGGITLSGSNTPTVTERDFDNFYAIAQKAPRLEEALSSYDAFLVDHAGEAKKILSQHLRDQERFHQMLNQDRFKQENLLHQRLQQSKNLKKSTEQTKDAPSTDQIREVTTKRPPAPLLRMPQPKRRRSEADTANTSRDDAQGASTERHSTTRGSNPARQSSSSLTGRVLGISALVSISALMALGGAMALFRFRRS